MADPVQLFHAPARREPLEKMSLDGIQKIEENMDLIEIRCQMSFSWGIC